MWRRAGGESPFGQRTLLPWGVRPMPPASPHRRGVLFLTFGPEPPAKVTAEGVILDGRREAEVIGQGQDGRRHELEVEARLQGGCIPGQRRAQGGEAGSRIDVRDRLGGREPGQRMLPAQVNARGERMSSAYAARPIH